MAIPTDRIFPLLIKLLSELNLQHAQDKGGLLAIEIREEDCSIEFQNESDIYNKNVDLQNLIRLLLQAESSLIPSNLSHETMLCHLGLLAPNLPVDLLPIITDCLAEDSNIRILDAAALLHRVELAYERHQLRMSPASNGQYSWDVGFDTHIGIRKSWLSQTNQDAFYFDKDKNLTIMMVADGISISTAGSGDLASQITAEVTRHLWSREKENLSDATEEDIRNFLINTLVSANFSICEQAKKIAGENLDQEIPMGSTVLLALARNDDVWLASREDDSPSRPR